MTLEPLDFFTLVLAVRISTHVIFIACLAMMVSGRRWTPELPFAARCLPRHVTMTSGAAGGSMRSTRVAPCQNELTVWCHLKPWRPRASPWPPAQRWRVGAVQRVGD